jgi:hypothetical protein
MLIERKLDRYVQNPHEGWQQTAVEPFKALLSSYSDQQRNVIGI